MSVAFTSIKGLTLYDSRKACIGATLFTPVDGMGPWLIDMEGGLVNYWEIGYKPSCYGELLPNGNLLYAGKVEDGTLADLEGTGGVLLEVDWNGRIVWEHRDPYLHHAFYRMNNGNTLILKWVKVPKEIAAKVKGGVPGTERDGVMWGDIIQEVTPQGRIAWEWIGHEHLDPLTNVICPICFRDTWTHANSIVELADRNILVNFMKTNTIAKIDKKTGKVSWGWGPHELGHSHSLSELDNGNVLVFDNGLHGDGMNGESYSRALEINPSNNKMVWSYGAFGCSSGSFCSSTLSSCQRLPNGNTFICEGITGRLFELTPRGNLAWEYVNGLPSYEPSPGRSKYCPVYAAYRYEMDYSGLRRPLAVTEVRQAAPGTSAPEAVAVLSRLEFLGY